MYIKKTLNRSDDINVFTFGKFASYMQTHRIHDNMLGISNYSLINCLSLYVYYISYLPFNEV